MNFDIHIEQNLDNIGNFYYFAHLKNARVESGSGKTPKEAINSLIEGIQIEHKRAIGLLGAASDAELYMISPESLRELSVKPEKAD